MKSREELCKEFPEKIIDTYLYDIFFLSCEDLFKKSHKKSRKARGEITMETTKEI